MPKSKEKCAEIKELTKEKILNGAIIWFARNGYAGTKISELAKFIGIGQGTMYSYFSSKEEIFQAILEKNKIKNHKNFQHLKDAPISAKEKIILLSKSMINEIGGETPVAYEFVLNLRMTEESGVDNSFTNFYGWIPCKILSEIIIQGQKDGTIILGDSLELAEYYWSVVHTLALMKIGHGTKKIIPAQWLWRILLIDKGDSQIC